MGRTTITAGDEGYEAIAAHKGEDESWTELLKRAADALEADDGGGELAPNTLTEEHIEDIAARTSRRTADELEDRLRGH